MEEHRFNNDIGSEYELYKLASPYYEILHQCITDILREKFGQHSSVQIMEIGFGTGVTSRAILRASDSIHLIGVDNEPMMLEKVSHLLDSEIKTGRVELKTEDALGALRSMKSREYEAVISGFVIHNFQNDYRSEVLKEIHRVLKSGGIFINGDKIAADNSEEHRKNYTWQIKQFQVYRKMGKPELADEWVKHYEEDERPDRVLREDDFIKELVAMGFTDVKLRERWYMDAVVTAEKA